MTSPRSTQQRGCATFLATSQSGLPPSSHKEGRWGARDGTMKPTKPLLLYKHSAQHRYNKQKPGLDMNTELSDKVAFNSKGSFESKYVFRMMDAILVNAWRAHQAVFDIAPWLATLAEPPSLAQNLDLEATKQRRRLLESREQEDPEAAKRRKNSANANSQKKSPSKSPCPFQDAQFQDEEEQPDEDELVEEDQQDEEEGDKMDEDDIEAEETEEQYYDDVYFPEDIDSLEDSSEEEEEEEEEDSEKLSRICCP
ncbi:hypothetical protein IV203_027916 [Nitzschia inconspicua]|uniref:Uncharacterized protein n=1 Tax=Nitzschia inconspicua TaxID=303405 RepID=A0A9K3LYL7_9STRA|nr:hypothetical protein IV203_027916 [Nitzschia inconspicua]